MQVITRIVNSHSERDGMGDKSRLTMRKEAGQRRSRETVDVILQAAAHVFSARGYAGCTTNHIARRAGVSIGSLYQYFPNKDAILVRLARGHLGEARRQVDAVLAEVRSGAVSPDRLIATVVRAMISLHKSDPALHRVIFEETRLERSILEELREIEESAISVLRAFIADGPRVPAVRADLMARIVVRAVEALTHHFVIYEGGRTDDETLIDEISRLVGGYLGLAP
jgi:AcrR family transcriptional regulator